MKNVVIIDNYDSFTYNLYQTVSSITGSKCLVFRNDQVGLTDILDLNPSHIIISPGPGHPAKKRDFGVSREIFRSDLDIPVLGVCLGHQGLGFLKGAKVLHAKRIVHGKPSIIAHNGEYLFKGLPDEFEAGRYHSLAVYDPPSNLEVTAIAEDGEIMGIMDTENPYFGIQFHPESILTPLGPQILKNFIAL